MNYDDSDMKIVPDRPSEIFDTSEGAANAFVREKSNGNMDKARVLGTQLAIELTAESKGGATLFGVGAFDNEHTVKQRKVMFAYVVKKVIEDMAPNSIVAQSALSAFYETIQQTSPEIYELATDTAAFSLYNLSARTSPEDPCAIGNVFALLCDREDDPVFVRYGCELASYFTMYCTQVALRVQMIR
ncbi:hypothetical protein V6615_04300 [Oscillospiraceae bacterium PP1C4]